MTLGVEKEPPFMMLSGSVVQAVRLGLFNWNTAAVHGQIKSWMNAKFNNQSWSSQEALSQALGMTDRSIRNHIKKLEKYGFLHIEKRPSTTDKMRALDRPGTWNVGWGDMPERVAESGREWQRLIEADLWISGEEIFSDQTSPEKISDQPGKNFRDDGGSPEKISDNIDLIIDIDLSDKDLRESTLHENPDQPVDKSEGSSDPSDARERQLLEAKKLCELLAQRVTQHFDEQRIALSQTPNPAKWISDMDKLLRLGAPGAPRPSNGLAFQPEQIERIITTTFDWFNTPTDNSGFCWADQIRSAKALRKAIDKLRIDLNRENKRRQGGYRPRNTAGPLANLSEQDRTEMLNATAAKIRAATLELEVPST